MIQLTERGAVPNYPHVICKANLEQKRTYHIKGTDIDLFIENKFNENLRERNPNRAEVVYVPEFSTFKGYESKFRAFTQSLLPGDIVYIQHFQLADHSGDSNVAMLDYDGTELFLVDLREVYFKVVDGTPIPFGSNMLCEYTNPEKAFTESGLIIPEVARAGRRRAEGRATVRYISPDVRNVSVGDKIMFEKHADYSVEFNDKQYLKITDDEVLGILTD